MKYLWTEDTGAGLHFWQLLNQLFFENAFDKLVTWTGIGKADKIKIREDVLSAIEDHRINLSKINNEKSLQYLEGDNVHLYNNVVR